MTRFRDLLRPDLESPREEQQRASAGLAEVVRHSKLRWKGGKGPIQCPEKCLLLAIAPYSQYDLVLLDLLDESIDSEHPGVPVYVTNLQDYDSVTRLAEDFPGVSQTVQPPVAALFESGTARLVTCGRKARDLAATALGLSPEELSRRVLEEAPRCNGKGMLAAETNSEGVSKDEEQLDDDELRYLWEAYREQNSVTGFARDSLPYTPQFAVIRARLNAHFRKSFTQQAIWKALSNLDKNPERRQHLGCVD